MKKGIEEKRYRIVNDFGYGDKGWELRMLTKKEVMEYWKKQYGYKPDKIEDIMDSDCIHYVEIDNESDQEDWDWQDS